MTTPPVTALPVTALPVTALPVTAPPVTTLLVGALRVRPARDRPAPGRRARHRDRPAPGGQARQGPPRLAGPAPSPYCCGGLPVDTWRVNSASSSVMSWPAGGYWVITVPWPYVASSIDVSALSFQPAAWRHALTDLMFL